MIRFFLALRALAATYARLQRFPLGHIDHSEPVNAANGAVMVSGTKLDDTNYGYGTAAS